MLASGNSAPETCVVNLMSIRRGECSYARVKGLDSDIVDSNIDSAELDLLEDAEFLVEQYEPRVSVDDVNLEPVVYEDNSYSVEVRLSVAEEDKDDVEENV